MLGTTLWLVTVLALLAAGLANGAAAFGRAAVQAAAEHALEAAAHDAVADYQTRLAGALAAGGQPPGALPLTDDPQPPAGAQPAGDGPALSVAYAVTPTTIAAPDCAAPAPAPTGPDAVAWLQCERSVRESRLSLRLSLQVRTGAGGAVLAQREQTVTLRTFGLPPYSAVVGRSDRSAPAPGSAEAAAAHEGDLGGGTVSGASPPPEPSPWPAGGTLIHVRFRCTAGDCAGAAPPDPDAGLRAGVGWANGNGP